MKIVYLVIAVIIFGSCNSGQYSGEFECYSEAINILFQKCNVDTLYVATNFPDFNVREGKLPEEIFDFNDLDRNQTNYIQIRPDSLFWNYKLFNHVKPIFNKKKRNLVHKARFSYSFDMKLEQDPNLNRTFLTFSPIYFDTKENKGFFIASEINNIKIGFTTTFFVSRFEEKFVIFDHVLIHRFMPY